MWKLIQLLIFGHVHTWKVIEHNVLRLSRHPLDGGGECGRGSRYVLQCETCGDLKQKDVV